MSIIIITEQSEKKIKKQSLEALSYGVALAKQLNLETIAVVMGESAEDLPALGQYGLNKIVYQKEASSILSDNKVAASFLSSICQQHNAQVIIFSNSLLGKAVAPRLSVKLKAGLVTGVIKLPDTSNGFVATKSVFSGKAFADIRIQTTVKIISLNANCYEAVKEGDQSAQIIESSFQLPASTIKVLSSKKNEGEISLADADRVVSGGRGLKGPENWGMIEELAKLLGAATACSRPVADSNWRPHHEHVGQTGVAISPNLYIAVGISGAIQHLAGVNRSKTIVVINNDPEAPFFKAADYGIVGDAFQVMPKIIEAVKNLG